MTKGDIVYFFLLIFVYLSGHLKNNRRAVVAVIAWLLDLQLPMQSVHIAIYVVSSNLVQGEL